MSFAIIMGSHSVTFHPTQVNTPRINRAAKDRYSIYLSRRHVRLSWPIDDWLHSDLCLESGECKGGYNTPDTAVRDRQRK